MKNLKELRELRAEKLDTLDELRKTAETEKRDFTDEEDTQREATIEEIEKLNRKIELAEKEEANRKMMANAGGHDVQTDRDIYSDAVKNYSVGRASKVTMSRGKQNLDGLEKEMHDEAARDMQRCGIPYDEAATLIPARMLGLTQDRAAITENGTTGVVGQSFVDYIYAPMVLPQAGADFMFGINDMRFPILGNTTSGWTTETGNVSDGGNALSNKDLTPNRLGSYVDYSKLAGLQHGPALEQALRRALGNSIGSELQEAVFTDNTGAGAPTDIKDALTEISASSISVLAAKLIEELAGGNVNVNNQSCAYIWSTDLISEIMTAAGVSGVQQLFTPVMGGSDVMGLVNGYRAYFCSQLEVITASTPVGYFAKWDELKIAQFGAIELLTDNYTQAVGGKTRLVANSYWDFKTTRNDYFKVGGQAQTT